MAAIVHAPARQGSRHPAAIAALLVAVAAAIGFAATIPNISPWYESLTKPSFHPPNFAFGPVWTLLYILIAFALWRILRLPSSARRGAAIADADVFRRP